MALWGRTQEDLINEVDYWIIVGLLKFLNIKLSVQDVEKIDDISVKDGRREVFTVFGSKYNAKETQH